MKTSPRIKFIFTSLFIATLASMMGIGIIEPILPLYAKNMGASGLMIGLIFAGFALSRGIFAPFIGEFSDGHGRKKLIISGLILYIIFSLAYTVADTPTALFIIRFLQGFATVMVTPIAQSYVGDITPPGKEGRYMNLFNISLFMGMAIGPAVGGFFADTFSMKAPFYAMAVMSIISLVLILVFVPKRIVPKQTKKKAEQKNMHSLRNTLRDHSMRGIMIYAASRGFTRWGFNTFFPLFAMQVLFLSKTNIGIFLSAYMLMGALLQYPAGIFSDKLHKHRNNIILISGALSTIPMFLIPLTKEVTYIFILMILMGGLSVFARATTIAIRTERGRIFGMGTTTGLFTTSLSIGQIFGPIIFGIIADTFGLNISFAVGGMVGLTGALVGFFYLNHEKHPVHMVSNGAHMHRVS